jgi:hypothetical protein
MNNKHMIRYGSDAENMRPTVEEDILIARLSLLVVMAKAFLKSYPMGEFREKAIRDNARFVFNEAFVRSRSNRLPSMAKTNPHPPLRGIKDVENLLLQRAQLLAVMVNSFAGKKSTGTFRKKAMAENIDQICEYLADGFHLGDTKILKVA